MGASFHWSMMLPGKVWTSSYLILMIEVPLICLLWPPTVAIKEPLLLMVGMDAFRWDLLDRAQTPNFEEVIGAGVRARHVVNVFPTKSSPNWYSLVTGLYPESHGIVNNHVYDTQVNCPQPALCAVPNCRDSKLWDGAEPLWITNQYQGGRSGVLNFPVGMTVSFDRMTANFTSQPSEEKDPDKEKVVDDIVELFASERINLGIIWFPDVDEACHQYGPESKEATAAVEEMDRTVGYLLTALRRHNLQDVLNILFVADHGQIEIVPSQIVFLEDFVNSSLYFGYQDNPIFSIFPYKDEDTAKIVEQLEGAEHLTVYTKDTIPDEYHYRNNKRIPPILVMADLGWNVAQTHSEDPYWNATVGEHGYSNNVSQMWPFFVAKGPAFRKGITSEPFSTLDIYSLVCHILRIEPRPHNGSLENVKHLLADGIPSKQPTVLRTFLGILLIVVAVLTCLLLLSCRKILKYRADGPTPMRIEEVEGLLAEDLDT